MFDIFVILFWVDKYPRIQLSEYFEMQKLALIRKQEYFPWSNRRRPGMSDNI